VRHGFLDETSNIESVIHALDVRAKMLMFLFLILVSLSTPPDATAAFAGYFGMLLVLLLLSRVPPLHLAKQVLVVLPFILLATALLPFLGSAGQESWSPPLAFLGNHRPLSPTLIFANVAQKAFFSAFTVLLFTSTTPFPKILAALQSIRIPRIFILILSFLYRYLFLLVDEAERMMRALKSRGYRGRSLFQVKRIGSLLGMFLLRSYERSERIYAAMLSRGFKGRFFMPDKSRLRAIDLILPVAVASAAVFLRLSVS
jgi:cobalt/nickel transport system permease protein